jgi:phage tail tape-measure protein
VHPLQNGRKEAPMRKSMAVAAVLSVTLLAACGTREPERAEGGAAAGAASGATVGLVGGPVGVVVGGAVGGVAGAATGAATKPSDVNVGAPPWHDNSQTGQNAAKHMAN